MQCSIKASAKSINVMNINKCLFVCRQVKIVNLWRNVLKFYTYYEWSTSSMSNDSDGCLTNDNWNNIDHTRYFGNLGSGVSLEVIDFWGVCVFLCVHVCVCVCAHTVSNSKSAEVVLCSHWVPSCDTEKPCRSGCQKEALKSLSDYYTRFEPFKHPSSHTRPFSSVQSSHSPLSSFFLFSDFTLTSPYDPFTNFTCFTSILLVSFCAKLKSHFR